MQYLMFTKHLEGMDVPEIIDTLKSVGVEGADLCVRPGYSVEPENAPTTLPAAAKQFAAEGLSIPLVTTPAEYLSTAVPYAESLMAACAEAGTPLIKLGYWRLTGDAEYWTLLDQCRKELDSMAKLAEKHGVKVCVHNHSGSSMGLNSCAAMNLVKGFDPKHVGIFFDPAHLSLVGEPIPERLQRWLIPQNWRRDTDGPIVSLGPTGAWDDTHLFAPCVAFEDAQYRLWYCGSTDTVAKRVFQLGLATSDDGREFAKWPNNPVYSFGDGRHSVLTPTLLRSPGGEALREDGKLRMWFVATDFAAGSPHQLHETTSEDGLHWSPPSPPQLDNVYAPTIVKEGDTYRMWFVDVGVEPWIIRHAACGDGRTWEVTETPVVVVNRPWERERLFYPTVLKCDGVYLMWYGSYWTGRANTTALGFAVSEDGLTWHKHPDNPVLRPAPERPWESHYTTSQSVRRLPDGSFRLWYASRMKPPFLHKYFAVCTARWEGLRQGAAYTEEGGAGKGRATGGTP